MCYTLFVEGGDRAMNKNITLRLDEAILRQARYTAVEVGQSLSQWVTGLIGKAVSKKSNFTLARKRALQRMDSGFRLGATPVRREELHER